MFLRSQHRFTFHLSISVKFKIKLVKLPVQATGHQRLKREAKNEVIFFAMDFSKKNRERKRTIGKSEPRRMELKIDEAALDAKIAAIRESNRHFFC